MEKAKSNKHIAPASATVSKVDMSAPSASPQKGTLVKKKNTAAGDPTIKNQAIRKHVTQTSGAKYGINVSFAKQTSPEAGKTQSNGKIVPAATNRTRPNFKSGISDLSR